MLGPRPKFSVILNSLLTTEQTMSDICFVIGENKLEDNVKQTFKKIRGINKLVKPQQIKYKNSEGKQIKLMQFPKWTIFKLRFLGGKTKYLL